ncbi:hypothetical protein C8Q73DRAFT_793484 [Cubamyces lactineus]|nr:hypothetical protein C8Q73DRAFT_793484 [Cubamyces lactineus]
MSNHVSLSSILIVQLTQMVLNLKGGNSTGFLLIWPYFTQVFTTITVSRLILNLRGLYFATLGGCETDSLAPPVESDMRFLGLDTAHIIGNLGATLVLPTHSYQPEYEPLDMRNIQEELFLHSNSASPKWETELGDTTGPGSGADKGDTLC